MSTTSFAFFLAAFIVAAASPGPAIAAILGRVLAQGPRGIAPFLAGLVLGDLTWLTLAVFGLSMLAQAFHVAFLIVKYLGALYLLWLAYRLWTAPLVLPLERATAIDVRSILGGTFAGLALSLGNPKTMLFYVALIPTILDLGSITASEYVELVVAIVFILTGIFGGYALMAARARRVLRSPRAVRMMNRVSGAVMAGAAAAVVAR